MIGSQSTPVLGDERLDPNPGDAGPRRDRFLTPEDIVRRKELTAGAEGATTPPNPQH